MFATCFNSLQDNRLRDEIFSNFMILKSVGNSGLKSKHMAVWF